MSARIYEQERLQLEVQEAIAEAYSPSRLSAEKVRKNLYQERNLTLREVADALWAAGYRLDVKLTRLP